MDPFCKEEVKRRFNYKNTAESMSACTVEAIPVAHCKKVRKGARRMPRLSEATKDVISCDKLREGANDL